MRVRHEKADDEIKVSYQNANMRLIFIPLFGVCLSGCIPVIHTAMCIDAKIPRGGERVNGYYEVSLKYPGHETIIRNIECESYYDSQCSTRGNSWAYREVGQERGWPSQKVTVNTEDHGPIEFSLPSLTGSLRESQ